MPEPKDGRTMSGKRWFMALTDDERAAVLALREDTPDVEREALQQAYNGVCGVLASLGDAGWGASALAAEVEQVRVQLAAVAFAAPA